MKREFKAHPLMILRLMRPFSILFVIPAIKGAVQYTINKKITGVVDLELITLFIILLIAVLRFYAFRLICVKKSVLIKTGFFFKKQAIIPIEKLSSVQTTKNPIDAVFGSVTYRINTEAGRRRRSDFEFKLSSADSAEVSALLFGEHKPTAVKFSAVKVAIMAASTSSAVTGALIAVPIINNTGKLIGVALNEMLITELNQAVETVNLYIPPIFGTISLIFLLFYAVAFVYLLFKYINFSLFLESEKLEVQTGFFVRRRTAFKKEAVNDVKIEQTPIMRLFKRYALKVSVGGYGDVKNEEAVIVPSARRGEIKQQFSQYFPFLEPDGDSIHATRNFLTKTRFLFLPELLFVLLTVASIFFGLRFRSFTRLILFLTVIIGGIILYYGILCLYEYRFGKLQLGNNIFSQTVKGFKTCEFYCPKEKVGQIKLVRYIPDLIYGTCRVVISICSESADSVRIRHIDYKTALSSISECFGISKE